ncbi:hypothetical protein N0V88_006705 [Collariella sp. IMI 366227]|nr:hypothetical protein N0V88_006705 [Collariella sp. IMI 366227]
MLTVKTGGLLLLQAAAFFSGAAARCTPCRANDQLLVLLRSQDQVASVTETILVTEIVTFNEETITVTVPAPSANPVTKRNAKRMTVEYPQWLASTYSPLRVSSACQCLSIPASEVTVTATANALTVTEDATVTGTTTSTLTTIAVVTVTKTPQPTPVTLTKKIGVYRKDTGVRLGNLFDSNGPAIPQQDNDKRFVAVSFTVLEGAKMATQVRITKDGSTSALAFGVERHPKELLTTYGSLLWTNKPTPPGSPQVPEGTQYAVESDIWTINLETNEIGWKWIAGDGTISPISLWKVGGRLYAVGDVDYFLYVTGMGPGANGRFEVVFKYEPVEN